MAIFDYNKGMPNSLCHIWASGHHKQYKPKSGLHAHSHYEILIVSKGGGEHHIEDKTHPVLDNQIFFLVPGQHHYFKPSASAKFTFLAIDDEQLSPHTGLFLRDFEFFQGYSGIDYIQDDSVLSITNVLDEILKELKTDNVNQEQLITSMITTLLIRLQRTFLKIVPPTIKSEKPPELVQDFFKLLSNQNLNSRFVKEFAKQLFVHPNYLNIMINKHTHQSASAWIHQQCIINAKRALLHSNDKISAIAAQLGFSSATHFTRFFKQYTNLTPKQFRKTP